MDSDQINQTLEGQSWSKFKNPSQQCIWASDYWANMLNIQALNAPDVFHLDLVSQLSLRLAKVWSDCRQDISGSNILQLATNIGTVVILP
jgi:hypothetical protein